MAHLLLGYNPILEAVQLWDVYRRDAVRTLTVGLHAKEFNHRETRQGHHREDMDLHRDVLQSYFAHVRGPMGSHLWL